MTSLFTSLSRRPAPCTEIARGAPDAGCDEAHLAACGWFDSSHDLLAGLCVTELATPEDAAELLRFVA